MSRGTILAALAVVLAPVAARGDLAEALRSHKETLQAAADRLDAAFLEAITAAADDDNLAEVKNLVAQRKALREQGVLPKARALTDAVSAYLSTRRAASTQLVEAYRSEIKEIGANTAKGKLLERQLDRFIAAERGVLAQDEQRPAEQQPDKQEPNEQPAAPSDTQPRAEELIDELLLGFQRALGADTAAQKEAAVGTSFDKLRKLRGRMTMTKEIRAASRVGSVWNIVTDNEREEVVHKSGAKLADIEYTSRFKVRLAAAQAQSIVKGAKIHVTGSVRISDARPRSFGDLTKDTTGMIDITGRSAPVRFYVLIEDIQVEIKPNTAK